MENEYEEKRQYPRYSVTADSLVLWHKCAGRVLDISEGGMAIDIIESPESLPEKWETIFHCPTTDTRIDGLRLQLVRQESAKTSDFGIITQTVGAKYNNPTGVQRAQIRQHLGHRNS
jgi:hypothetical protein